MKIFKHLMTVVLLLIVCYASGQRLVLGDSTVIPDIKAKSSQIYEKADKTHFLLTKSPVHSIESHGTSITVKVCGDKICRIIAISTVDKGTLSTEWYFDGDALIFVYETMEYFSEMQPPTTHRNFKKLPATESRYYFIDDGISCQVHLGVKKEDRSRISRIRSEAFSVYEYVRKQLAEN